MLPLSTIGAPPLKGYPGAYPSSVEAKLAAALWEMLNLTDTDSTAKVVPPTL